MSNLFTISSRITGGIFDNDTNHYSQFQKLMQNVYYGPEPEDYDFIDCVTADSDKLLLDYDITDFEYYSVIVADKCGNMMTYELNPENIGLSSGTWIFDDLVPYVLVINDDNTSGKLVSLTDSSAYEISIRKENNFYKIYNDHNEIIGAADVFSGNKIKFTLFEEEISAVCKFYNANQNMFFYDDAKINELTEKFISEKFSDYKVTKTHFQEGFDTVYLNYTLEKDSSEEYLGMEVSRTSGKFSYLFDNKETDECLYLYDSDILKGDTDNNGLINVKDFIILKKYILGYSNIEVIPHFDINSDGKINVMDLGVLKSMMLAG
mgnify:CR=1 FL=1